MNSILKILQDHCDIPPIYFTELKTNINKINKEKNQLKSEIQKLKEENEKLKEENEKLKSNFTKI